MKKVGLLIFLIGIIGLMGMAVVAQDETPQSPIITPENVTQIQELQMLGRGNALETIFSPDGTMLAVASSIGIWLYDFNDLDAEPRLLEGHTRDVASIDFSPDGRFIASGSYDETLRIWDVVTGEQLHVIEMPKDITKEYDFNPVYDLDYSPDGRFIVTGSGQISIWDGRTGDIVQQLAGHENSIKSIAYSPDGRIIVGGSDYCINPCLHVWDVTNGILLKTLTQDYNSIYDIDFSLDGQFMTIGLNNNNMKIWNTQTWEEVSIPQVNDLSDYSPSATVAYSPDSRFIATGGVYSDPNIRIWDIVTGENILTLVAHANWVISLDYSPNGQFLVSSGRYGDDSIRIWDTTTGEQIDALNEHLYGLSGYYSLDGQSIISSAQDDIRIWDTQTWTITHTLGGHTVDWWLTSSYSPDGRFLATAGKDNICLWDTTTWQELNVFDFYDDKAPLMTFRPNGQLLSMWTFDDGIAIYEASTNKFLFNIIGGDANHSKNIVFSPDRKIIAFNPGTDNTLQIWDGETGDYLYTLTEPAEWINFMQFSTDGEFIIFASGGTLQTWSLETRQEVSRMTINTNITCLDYSPDQRLIIFSDSLTRITQIWDIETNQKLHEIDEGIGCGGFSPDGRTLAFSVGGTIRIWGIPPSSTP